MAGIVQGDSKTPTAGGNVEPNTEDEPDMKENPVIKDEHVSGLCDWLHSECAEYLSLCNIPWRTRDGFIPFPADDSIEDHVRWSIAVRKRGTVRSKGTTHPTRYPSVVATS